MILLLPDASLSISTWFAISSSIMISTIVLMSSLLVFWYRARA